MTQVTHIELPVDFSVVRCRRVNPFHWALLKALRSFVPGARPNFETLAQRLRIIEPSFLTRAWVEIRELKGADDDDFAQARLSALGEAALETHSFVLGEPELHSQKLYFKKADAEPVPGASFEVSAPRNLKAKPEWGDKFGAEEIADALAKQTPGQALRRDERIQSFTLRWQEAQEVHVTLAR